MALSHSWRQSNEALAFFALNRLALKLTKQKHSYNRESRHRGRIYRRSGRYMDRGACMNRYFASLTRHGNGCGSRRISSGNRSRRIIARRHIAWRRICWRHIGLRRMCLRGWRNSVVRATSEKR